jgi:Flp pilus assembly protein TadG
MRAIVQKTRTDESGVAMLEAAIVFPFLITLGFGVFDFSNYFYLHQAVVAGVRDAARYLARNACATANPSVAPAISCASQIGAAEQIAVYGDIGAAAPRVASWTVDDLNVTFAATANPLDPTSGDPIFRGADPIYTVTVSTSFAYSEIGFLTMLGFADPTIAVSHTERVVGG